MQLIRRRAKEKTKKSKPRMLTRMKPSPAHDASILNENICSTRDSRNKFSTLTKLGSDTCMSMGSGDTLTPFLNMSM